MPESDQVQQARPEHASKKSLGGGERAAGGGSTPVLQLQRAVGNAATGRLLRSGANAMPPTIQRKGAVTERSKSVAHDEYGGTTTTKSTTKTKGTKDTDESSSDVFDGTTQKQSSVKHETFKGAEAAVKTISSSSDTEIKQAIETMARAGVFGESSRKAAITRGALHAKAEGSASGKAGVDASFKGSVTVSPDLYNALVAVMEAAAFAGVQGSVQGSLEAGLGPLSVGISAKLDAMAGAMASVKGKLDVGITHLYAEFAAEAFAGAKATGDVTVNVKLGDGEAKAGISGEVLAGAEAKAGGSFKMDLSGVELSGKAEAFAGVKASATGKAEFAYKGRTIFKATGTVGVSAGVGGKAEGGFSFRGGKLKIEGNIAATLGIGGEVGASLEIDFYALALMIEQVIVDFFLKKKEAINRDSPAVERTVIIDEALAAKTRQKGYDAYVKDFQAYNAKKAKQGKSGIKRERVQEILDKRWHANKDNWQFIEFDEGIKRAAREAFGSNLVYIDVQCGQLRAFQAKHTDEQAAHIKKQRMKQGLKF